ncbi:MAG: serine hydrolase [Ignavibacteria bacterium]|nr:serine hydrolase [Ignavibacteria bacterium]
MVADQGDILINANYGYANLDLTKELSSESVYEIASISKQFTALLIMMLKEENKLDYDDKITKYLPTLPYDNITIRHLLTHTSGLSERQFFMWAGQNMDPTKIYTNELILKYLEKENPELEFEPGEKWEYSNLGYFLLPLILQQSTAKNYIQLLNDKIFSTLGMNNSGIFSQDFKGNEMDNYVFGKVYNPKDTAFKSSFGMAWSDSIYGGVGILSNTLDLLKWDRALYSNSLVSQKTLQEAFKTYMLKNDSSSKYGFGWYIKENKVINGINYGKRVDHNGLWPGYESSIVRYIDRDKTIIILSNQSPSSKDKLIEEISDLLFQTK